MAAALLCNARVVYALGIATVARFPLGGVLKRSSLKARNAFKFEGVYSHRVLKSQNKSRGNWIQLADTNATAFSPVGSIAAAAIWYFRQQ